MVGCVTDFDESNVLNNVLPVVLDGVVIFSVVGITGAFCPGFLVVKGFSSISGISCLRPLLPDNILEMLG